jgi:hypothetical protein
MLRRSLSRFNKAPQNPGPTMQGWGRTAQKRRLEYETVENKYGTREFTKQWDYCGLETRTTDHSEVRLYFNFPQRMLGFAFNWWAHNLVAIMASVVIFIAIDKYVHHVDHKTKRAAWW